MDRQSSCLDAIIKSDQIFLTVFMAHFNFASANGVIKPFTLGYAKK